MLATPLTFDPWPKLKLLQTRSNPSLRRLAKGTASTLKLLMAAKKAVAKVNIDH
jgi:hypothetical protein